LIAYPSGSCFLPPNQTLKSHCALFLRGLKSFSPLLSSPLSTELRAFPFPPPPPAVSSILLPALLSPRRCAKRFPPLFPPGSFSDASQSSSLVCPRPLHSRSPSKPAFFTLVSPVRPHPFCPFFLVLIEHSAGIAFSRPFHPLCPSLYRFSRRFQHGFPVRFVRSFPLSPFSPCLNSGARAHMAEHHPFVSRFSPRPEILRLLPPFTPSLVRLLDASSFSVTIRMSPPLSGFFFSPP